MGGRKLKRIWRRLRTKNQGKKKSIQASVDLPGFPCHGMQSRALRRGRSGLGLGERLAQLGGSRRAGWRRSQARRIGRGWTRGCPGAPDALVERCGSFAVSGDRRKQPPIHLRASFSQVRPDERGMASLQGATVGTARFRGGAQQG